MELLLHHLGYACKDIDSSVEYLKKYHSVIEVGDVIYDELQKAKLCFLEIANAPNIELVSGVPVANIVDSGLTFYHACYEVDNIDSAILEFKKDDAVLISKPLPAKLFANRKVAFLQTNLGLIELLESHERKLVPEKQISLELFSEFSLDFVGSYLNSAIKMLQLPIKIEYQPANQLFISLMACLNNSIIKSDSLVRIILIRFSDFLSKSDENCLDLINEFSCLIHELVDKKAGAYFIVVCPEAKAHLSEAIIKGANAAFLKLKSLPDVFLLDYKDIFEKYRKRSSERILPFLDVTFFEMKRHQSFELLQGLTSGYLG
jgi:methylmalonyl-CoA/ethylmalonyl-CoA epimerase